MYTNKNFKTKKELREAVAAFNAAEAAVPGSGKPIYVYNPGLGGPSPMEGRVCLEGPHYPAAHTWYAEATLSMGRVVKVK